MPRHSWVLGCALTCVLLPTPWAAATTVTNLGNVGAGSLRDEIAATTAGGTVDFAPGLTGTITLTSGQILIDKNLNLQGPGAAVLAVSGNNFSRIFQVGPGVTASISGLTISNGRDSSGFGAGGILNQGTLSVSASTFSGNICDADGGGILNFNGATLCVSASSFSGNTSASEGGGIFNQGTLSVTASTFSGNNANSGGGGVSNNSSVLRIVNCTFSGNTTPGSGGAISDTSAVSQISITNSTFSSNSAATSGNTFFRDNSTMTLRNTLVAGNGSGSNCAGGVVTDGGGNLEDGSSCGFTTSQSNTPAGLADPNNPQDNGGPTLTLALLPGSAAIDAADPDTCADPNSVANLDQRGVVRPIDGDLVPGAICDVGAFEAPELPTPTPTKTFTPTETSIPTETPTPTETFTPSATPTSTLTAPSTLTRTPTSTFTITPIPTFTGTPTRTSAVSPSSTASPTRTPSPTPTLPAALLPDSTGPGRLGLLLCLLAAAFSSRATLRRVSRPAPGRATRTA